MKYHVIGDLHGHLNDYRRLLAGADLIDGNDDWCGGNDQLWLIGDFFDRGRYGVGCVELSMKLQQQARAAGGEVNGILGNHEMMILCAYRFRDTAVAPGMTVIDQWRRWGGIDRDLETLNDSHVQWLSALPVMHKIGDRLLVHADAMFYVELGRTIDLVNERFRKLLEDDNLNRWEYMLRAFAEHQAFSGLSMTGSQRAQQLLTFYGARQLIHGHTPIPVANGSLPAEVTQAWEYCGGRCVNVDGGIYMGGPGFVYQFTA